jgi:hypothetical protein
MVVWNEGAIKAKATAFQAGGCLGKKGAILADHNADR